MSKKPAGHDAVVTPPPRPLPPDFDATLPMQPPAGAAEPSRAAVEPEPSGAAGEPTPTLSVPAGSAGRAKIPSQIGRYQILERVGKGGMGVLYRGIDPVLDREVAIKLMLGDFSDDHEQLRPRFYREARAVAKLQHRNIVTVFEFAEDGTTPYIVMEFLRGTSLASRMESPQPLTLDDKLDIVAQLCAGLGYAHEQGIIHRDVKPANVFLLNDGTVKLLDFGIAKLTTSNLTRQGDVLGSPSYMSPEQIMGNENIDGRADVFSTGVMLYELLAGRKPFDAETTTAIVLKILNEEPLAVETIDPMIPPKLCAVVKKALEKDPAARFASAADLARELQTIRRSLTATEMRTIAMPAAVGPTILTAAPPVAAAPPPAPAAGRNWMVPAVIGTGLVAAGLVAAVLLNRPSPRPPVAVATTDATTGAVKPTTPPPTAAPVATEKPTPAVVTTSATKETRPTPPATSTGGATLQVVSEPAGASIFIDGKDTRLVTPAQIAIKGSGPHRLRLTRRGFQPVDARLAAADLQKGSLNYTLTPAEAAPAAATIAVSASGAYPFAIYDGGRMISAANTSHELNVGAGKRLRLVAPEYLLNQTVTVEASDDKRAEFQVPALANVTIRSSQETCKLKIGDRDLGYPPINNLKMAGGAYQIDVVCPNGQNKSQFINVTPGSQNARVILQ
jgi:eukaryotic-like serine/threonine-protein kinase